MKKNELILSALLLIPVSAWANGFQSLEQNASGLGVSYAGSAVVADNASTIFYNPAGMTLLPESQMSLGFAGVLHRYEFDDDGSFGIQGHDGGNAGHWRVQPNAYFAWTVGSRWVAGLGISSPHASYTDYDSGWIGQSFVSEARLRSTNLNPSLAYRFSRRISLGFGLNYQKLRLETGWTDAMGNGLRRSDTEDAAWGWNAGVLMHLSPVMRVGVAYRSGMTFDLGQEHSQLPGIDRLGDLKTPGALTLSVWQQVSPQWEAMGDLSYIRWKTVDGYDHDGWRFAWGAAYAHNERWKSKFGLAYEHGPLRRNRTAALPDNHRLWFSLGGQYRLDKRSTLDFGYAYQWVKTPGIDQRSPGLRLRGDYDASGHVLGVQYTQDF